MTRTGCTISPKTSHKTPKSHPCLTHLEDRPSRDHTLSLLLPLAPLASSNLLGRLGTFPSLICFNGGPSPSPPPSCSRVTGRLELLVSETSICTCKICQIQNENSKKKKIGCINVQLCPYEHMTCEKEANYYTPKQTEGWLVLWRAWRKNFLHSSNIPELEHSVR